MEAFHMKYQRDILRHRRCVILASLIDVAITRRASLPSLGLESDYTLGHAALFIHIARFDADTPAQCTPSTPTSNRHMTAAGTVVQVTEEASGLIRFDPTTSRPQIRGDVTSVDVISGDSTVAAH